MRRYSYILVLLSMLFACVAVSCAPELDEAYVPDNMETVEVDVLFRVDDMVTKAMTAVEEDTAILCNRRWRVKNRVLEGR